MHMMTWEWTTTKWKYKVRYDERIYINKAQLQSNRPICL